MKPILFTLFFLLQKNKQMKEFMIEILGPGNSIFLVVVDAINMEHARTDVRAAMKRLP